MRRTRGDQHTVNTKTPQRRHDQPQQRLTASHCARVRRSLSDAWACAASSVQRRCGAAAASCNCQPQHVLASVVALLTHDRVPSPHHPAPWWARALPLAMQRLGAAGACLSSESVCSPTTSTRAPRNSAADRRHRRPGPAQGLPGPSRPRSVPGRPWSSLVFVGRSAFGLRAGTFRGCTTPAGRKSVAYPHCEV